MKLHDAGDLRAKLALHDLKLLGHASGARPPWHLAFISTGDEYQSNRTRLIERGLFRMNWSDEKKLESMTRIGTEVRVIDRQTGRETFWGVVEDEVAIVVEDAKHVIQRIRLADDARRNGDEYGYKTGTFFVNRHTGRIKWAQYAQAVTESELQELLALAKKKGWPVL